MTKIKAAVIGYGNIGRFAVQALEAEPDFEIAGIVRRNTDNVPEEIAAYKVTDSIKKLDADVAIICAPTRNIEPFAEEALSAGINTVDSFDIHTEIWGYRTRLDKVAKAHSGASIISAGWDPGTDSLVRSIMQLSAPKGVTHTNFGPGMSMGHTVAVKAIEGVENALSMTIPLGTGVHRRLVYIELKKGYTLEEVSRRIKKDDYFAHDETIVRAVDHVDDLLDMGHATDIVRKGVSGITHNQNFEFKMTINNPALTAQILVSAARAVMLQKPGAYTLIEVPLIDFLYGDRESLIRSLI